MAAPEHVVLVHGLWHGPWCWQPVVEALRELGIQASAIELPMRSLAGDAEVVTAALDAMDADVVLVGHSYGGAVITAAGEHPRVRELVYLAAFALTEDESVSRVAPQSGVAPTALGSALRISEDGTEIAVDPEQVRELMYHRSPPERAAHAVARLRPVARAVFSARPQNVAWRRCRATYVVCTDDRTVAPDLQRIMAARVERTLEWDCDHTPLAAEPERVAGLLAAIARGQRIFGS